MRKLLFATAFALASSACNTVTLPPATAPGPNFLSRNAAAERVISTPSGLQYFIVRSGPKTGRRPSESDTVTLHYEGKLTTGETFDSSFERGEPIIAPVSAFVPGFTEALKLMKPGDEWIVWIPPELGYGDKAADTIPASSVLRFRLLLQAVSSASRH